MSEPSLTRLDGPPAIPPRPADGHKGMFGRVLIVAGSHAMPGAPVLVGTAALRLGSGLVQLALPHELVNFALSVTPELISLPLPMTPARALLADAAAKADVLVMGPGLGTERVARARVRRLIMMEMHAVLDADALNILAEEGAWFKEMKLKAVLTPHPGEMARLGKLIGSEKVPTDDEGRIDLAVAASKAFGQVMLLKGHRTVVTDGSRVYLNDTGDSSLSKAGAGDVLSGMIGSLIGQGMDPFEAACAGAHLHGKAGELAGKRLGMRCVLARDVIDAIPAALA